MGSLFFGFEAGALDPTEKDAPSLLLGSGRSDWQCTNGQINRTVSLIITLEKNPVCAVWYDKRDEGKGRKMLWSAANDPAYCTPKAGAFLEKLTRMGWACRLDDTVQKDALD
ncbi:MAG: hypothetical protein AAGF15_09090 [Pseudomonadota bacterium]